MNKFNYILTVAACDTVMEDLTGYRWDRYGKQLRLERRLRRFRNAGTAIDDELNEIMAQLLELDANIAQMPDGGLKDAHIQRRSAVQLRERTLNHRAPEYSQEVRDYLQLLLDSEIKMVLYWEQEIELLKQRRVELEGSGI